MATNLRVAELDFDLIKSNLREFLRSKPEFTDYDFEGSGLSVIMDLLAYNTHYNAVIGNMLIQELYLDTAVKKQSLALIAKRLGYLPRGYRAPRAVVTMEVFPSGAVESYPDTLTLGKNAKFTTRLSNTETASFVTRDAITINKDSNNRFIFPSIELYEGDNAVFRYIVTNPASQKFEIPSTLVDTTLVRVYVQDSISSTNITEYVNFNSIVDLTPTTNAYFLKLNENLRYEVYFGDDVLGKNVVTGNVVVIDYVGTNGPIANGASTFTFTDSVSGYSNVVVSTLTTAYGGAYPESLDSIRSNAQNQVLTQNRAVTEADYATLISNIVPVETIAVYGGETVSPPEYGKVFISLKQSGITAPLTEAQKQDIITQLKRRSVLSLVHEFVDPEYTYLGIDTQVKFDPKRTTLNTSTLKTLIFTQLQTYGAERLNKFESTFEYSNLVGFIDDIENSIKANDTLITLRKESTFVHNVDNQYRFAFYTELKPSNSKESNITSTAFKLYDYPNLDCFIDDNDGAVRVYYLSSNQKVFIDENAGTVDYTNGIVVVNLKTVLSTNNKLAVTAVPLNKNLIPSRNNILTLLDQDINITMLAA
jgi:hypothetical protein